MRAGSPVRSVLNFAARAFEAAIINKVVTRTLQSAANAASLSRRCF